MRNLLLKELKDDANVNHESLEDTFKDAANYGMIGLLLKRKLWKRILAGQPHTDVRHCLPRLNLATPPEMRLRRQGLRGKFTMRNQPQRLPSHHDSVTVWHLGHSMRDDRKRCARTKIGASVVPQYLQRGGST